MSHDGIENLGVELQRILDAAEEFLRDGAGSAVGKELGTRARRLDGTVRAHPWESIAMVGVSAFLLGLLVRRL